MSNQYPLTVFLESPTCTGIRDGHDDNIMLRSDGAPYVIGDLTGVCKPGDVHRVTIAPPSDDDCLFLILLCKHNSVANVTATLRGAR